MEVGQYNGHVKNARFARLQKDREEKTKNGGWGIYCGGGTVQTQGFIVFVKQNSMTFNEVVLRRVLKSGCPNSNSASITS